MKKIPQMFKMIIQSNKTLSFIGFIKHKNHIKKSQLFIDYFPTSFDFLQHFLNISVIAEPQKPKARISLSNLFSHKPTVKF